MASLSSDPIVPTFLQPQVRIPTKQIIYAMIFEKIIVLYSLIGFFNGRTCVIEMIENKHKERPRLAYTFLKTTSTE